jgi:hypothetical protein
MLHPGSMIEHGFSIDSLVDLASSGLATTDQMIAVACRSSINA